MPGRASAYGTREPVTVVQSQDAEGGALCAAILERADGGFGFELFRRDLETGEGWFRLGPNAGRSFAEADDAFAAASRWSDRFAGR
jgi:hypothetical protein